MVTHIVGGALGAAIFALCVTFSFLHKDPYAVVSSFLYGFSTVVLYTISGIYHGLLPEHDSAKKVMQIIDHCSIFFVIAGTYTPIALCSLRRQNTAVGWVVFGFIWALAALGITLNGIDLKAYKRFSMICYLAMGWCAVLTLKLLLADIGFSGFLFLLLGGVAFSVGAVLYVLGGKKKIEYIHSVFHIFVVLGSVLQFFCIFFYVI